MKRFINETITTDIQTGELLTTTKTYRTTALSNDSFFMTFESFHDKLLKINSIADYRLLMKMCALMEFNTNIVYIPSSRRKEIAKSIGVHISNISHSFRRLKELDLVRGEDGTYQVNYMVIWKGTTNARAQLIKEGAYDLNQRDKMFNEREEPISHDVQKEVG